MSLLTQLSGKTQDSKGENLDIFQIQMLFNYCFP